MNLINHTKPNFTIHAANFFILVAILLLAYQVVLKFFNLS